MVGFLFNGLEVCIRIWAIDFVGWRDEWAFGRDGVWGTENTVVGSLDLGIDVTLRSCVSLEVDSAGCDLVIEVFF